MKKNLLFLVFALYFVPVSAQQNNAQDWKQKGRHQIELSWGMDPTQGDIDWFEDSPISYSGYDTESNKGAFSAHYLYRLTSEVSVGVVYSYSFEKGKANPDFPLFPEFSVLKHYSSYHTIMPQFKVNWLNWKWLTLYSRMAVGLQIESKKTTYKDDSKIREKETYFACQMSPVGFEFGKRLAVFGEVGFGMLGEGGVFGVRYRL